MHTSASRYFRVFLSSPGDVKKERELATQILQELNHTALLQGKVIFDIVAWDKPGASVAMEANLIPQEAINQGLPKPSECDIVVVIFWTRMGTPLPFPDYKKTDEEPFLSGTEWEYEDALGAFRKQRKPRILVYHRTEDYKPKTAEQKLQYERVQNFFSKFSDSQTGVIYQGQNSYHNPQDFAPKFKAHIIDVTQRILKETQQSEDAIIREVSQEVLRSLVKALEGGNNRGLTFLEICEVLPGHEAAILEITLRVLVAQGLVEIQRIGRIKIDLYTVTTKGTKDL
jgi:hypothetical protein